MWLKAAQRVGEMSGKVVVWCAGVHTAQLFDRTPLLSKTRIAAIVDRDSQKWGHTQAGTPIISPGEFLARNEDAPIVISSYAAEADIARDLAAHGVPQDRIIRLYN